jgi:hypothetical protein
VLGHRLEQRGELTWRDRNSASIAQLLQRLRNALKVEEFAWVGREVAPHVGPRLVGRLVGSSRQDIVRARVRIQVAARLTQHPARRGGEPAGRTRLRSGDRSRDGAGDDSPERGDGEAVLTDVGQSIYERVLDVESRRRRVGTVTWLASNSVVPVSRWARFSRSLRRAHEAGLGWLLPVRGELLLVPMPAIRNAEGRPDVLHDDTGRPAIEWPDGSGTYFLNGVEFTKSRYFEVIRSELLIQEIAALGNADQRSIALTYMSFERLVLDSDAELIDVGIRGTRLYRLPLPFCIRADRIQGYGGYDYFIHMRDASHPERQFIEWVDPLIGRQRKAELCQAHAFGISLEEWLSIRQEG